MSKAIELGCLILCGGRGTRLQSVVPDKPKALAEVNGIPFIYLLLKQLGCFQFGEVILCTGYQGNQVKDAVGEQYENLKVIYSEENEPLGTGGAIKNAVTHIRQPDGGSVKRGFVRRIRSKRTREPTSESSSQVFNRIEGGP